MGRRTLHLTCITTPTAHEIQTCPTIVSFQVLVTAMIRNLKHLINNPPPCPNHDTELPLKPLCAWEYVLEVIQKLQPTSASSGNEAMKRYIKFSYVRPGIFSSANKEKEEEEEEEPEVDPEYPILLSFSSAAEMEWYIATEEYLLMKRCTEYGLDIALRRAIDAQENAEWPVPVGECMDKTCARLLEERFLEEDEVMDRVVKRTEEVEDWVAGYWG